jgi:hypothetical protein
VTHHSRLTAVQQRPDPVVDLIAVPARSSWTDRLGPDIGRVVEASACGALVMAVCALFGIALRSQGHIQTPLVGVMLASAVIGALVGRALYGFADAVGAGFRSFLQPSGASTPYQRDYSMQEAMAIGGDVHGAIASYVALIEATPDDVEARIALAELCARSGYATEAADAFADVRRVPGVSAQRDLYATSRLVDLYAGPLAQPGRALVELRRLAEKHAGTREADAAVGAIARIKAERREGAKP